MVEPTLRGRIVSLDVLRGFAILGILLANIGAFHYPVLATELQMKGFEWHGVDLLIEQWTTALVVGKFRGLLCILFGAGLWLQFQRRTEWPGGYTRRMLILFGIGCFHGIFIWFGDILATYALTALLTFWVAKLPTVTLWKIVLGLFLFSLTCGLGLMAMGSLGHADPASLGPLKDIVAGEGAAYADGNYGIQLLYRGSLFLLTLLGVILLVPGFGMLFIVGVILAREDFFRNPDGNPALRNRLLAVGLGLGLPLNLVALACKDATTLVAFQNLVEIAAGGLLSVGYLITGCILVSRIRGVWWTPLANVGRMALTCYLLQSLICTTIFYSYGLGLYGTMSRPQLLQVVVGVWIFNLVFSAVWLRFFTIGPVECLWRSWSEGIPFDLRQRGRLDVEAPPRLA